jgi:hypothetical protein
VQEIVAVLEDYAELEEKVEFFNRYSGAIKMAKDLFDFSKDLRGAYQSAGYAPRRKWLEVFCSSSVWEFGFALSYAPYGAT